MTSLRVELPQQKEPPKVLNALPSNTTWTDLEGNRERVLPIVAVLFKRARMAEGYREMGAFDLQWAERDLPATLEVLPTE